jgi:3',5'-cyclic AMP phosphodiesterase CpdA
MKKAGLLKKIVLWLFIGAIAYSLVPVVVLYLKKDPAPQTNESSIAKLKKNKGEKFKFIVLGDCHTGLIFNDSAMLKIARRINREDIFRKIPTDFVAIAGDLTFRGTAWDYRIYNRVRSLIKRPVVAAVGNHDNDKGGTARFRKYAGKDEFSFADRNSYFIFVDNTVRDLNAARLAALEEELKRSKEYRHRFVMLHKPPASPYQQSWYRPESSPWSYKFMKLCEAYGVDMVFSGHEHMYKEMSFGGVKYIVTGGGGIITHISTPDGGYLHYLVVRINGDYVDYEVRKVFPPLWEYLAYYMWKDLYYLLKDIFA